MAEIKLTKSELRSQQLRLAQLEKYLPTLQLKKAMLQAEVLEARVELEIREREFEEVYTFVDGFSALLSVYEAEELKSAVRVTHVARSRENIAGIDIPKLESVEFAPIVYGLLDTPPWADSAVRGLRKLAEARIAIEVAREKEKILEKELKEVAIRVNLFEKILIPRAEGNIKKIRVFLGDQQLAAVSRAKVAKVKIEERRKVHGSRCV